jgi:hypothetical protein
VSVVRRWATCCRAAGHQLAVTARLAGQSAGGRTADGARLPQATLRRPADAGEGERREDTEARVVGGTPTDTPPTALGSQGLCVFQSLRLHGEKGPRYRGCTGEGEGRGYSYLLIPAVFSYLLGPGGRGKV